MRIKTVRERWEEYAEFIFANTGVEKTSTQYRETRRAFYAGFVSCLMMGHDEIGSEEVSEDEGVAIMESMLAECKQFYQDVKEGRA